MRSYASIFLGLLAVQQAAAVSSMRMQTLVYRGLKHSIDQLGRLPEATNLLRRVQPVYRPAKVRPQLQEPLRARGSHLKLWRLQDVWHDLR